MKNKLPYSMGMMSEKKKMYTLYIIVIVVVAIGYFTLVYDKDIKGNKKAENIMDELGEDKYFGRLLKFGVFGTDVMLLQTYLKTLGAKIRVNGLFSIATKEALKSIAGVEQIKLNELEATVKKFNA